MSLPKRLKSDFSEHEVFTVRDRGWNGIKNGELLQLMVDHEFQTLLTFDKNLQHQQNFAKYPLTVFVLSAVNNTYQQLVPLVPFVKKIIDSGRLQAGPIVISNK